MARTVVTGAPAFTDRFFASAFLTNGGEVLCRHNLLVGWADNVATRTLGLAKERDAGYLLASTSEAYGNPKIHPQPETRFELM